MCGQLFLHPATRVSRLRTNPKSMTSESQPQDIWCQNDRTLRSWSRPEIHYPAQHEDTTLRLQIDLRIVNQQTTIVSPSHVVITGIPIVDPKKGMAALIKSRESPCRLVRTLMRNSIGNTVGIMLLCFEILIMSECSSPGELLFFLHAWSKTRLQISGARTLNQASAVHTIAFYDLWSQSRP